MCFSSPIPPPVSWNAEMIAGALAVILDHDRGGARSRDDRVES